MKYTIFTPCEPSFLDVSALLCVLESCVNLHKEGHKITIINCNGDIPLGCCYNRSHNKWVCKNCQRYKNILLKLLPSDIQTISLSKYASHITGNYHFEYTSMEEIKKCEYKNVEIGYCCLSAYIFLSRNLYPKIDMAFKSFFDLLMRQSCQYTDMVEAAIEDTNPDVLGCFNDRFVYCRPVVNIAQNRKMDYICFEWWHRMDGDSAVATYENVEVHDLDNRYQLLLEMWEDDSLPIEEKIKSAESFFHKRRNSIYSGDKLYVKDQILGELPQQWDDKEQNIVILNSSEDEGASLGKAYEKDKDENLFTTQYQGLKYIAEKYKDCENIHFYLRVHPNLKKVNYSYHHKLYELEALANNFTVIPANSTISTYSLIDASDKVIVFGSTTGIEAAYWGKPVILLVNCIYKRLGFCYCPSNLDELNDLIMTKSLESKKNDGVLKYAYYFMNDYYPPYKTSKHKIKRVKFMKHDFEVFIYDIGIIKKLKLIFTQIIGKWHLFPAFHDYPKTEDPNAIL